jgi:hypothetical protein
MKRHLKKWWPIYAWFIFCASVGIVIYMVVADFENTPPEPGILLPCVTEDSDNCWWDATEHGNGEGLSFVVIDGKVTYLAPKGH